jgi:hypothetical protein
MLWLLDEAANIAPVHDLPALVSQAGGQSLQVVIGLQDLSQARARWGADAADGFLTCAGAPRQAQGPGLSGLNCGWLVVRVRG